MRGFDLPLDRLGRPSPARSGGGATGQDRAALLSRCRWRLRPMSARVRGLDRHGDFVAGAAAMAGLSPLGDPMSQRSWIWSSMLRAGSITPLTRSPDESYGEKTKPKTAR